MTRSEVESLLDRGGYQLSDSTFARHHFKGNVENGGLIYEREANFFPCNAKIWVIVGYDKTDQLHFAKGVLLEHGCI